MITTKMLDALESLVSKNEVVDNIVDGIKDSVGDSIKDAMIDQAWDSAGDYLTTLPLFKTLDPDTVDYTLSVLRLLSDNKRYEMAKEILVGSANLWLVKVPVADGVSERQCVLEYNGMFTDHNSKSWLSSNEMQTKFGYVFTSKYNVPTLVFTWIAAKITKVITSYMTKKA